MISQNNEVVVSVEGLRVDFENLTAVDNISFQLKRGEVMGLVGPNGAGKTTTFKVLATLLEPTLGRITINGRSLENNSEIRKSLGFMPDYPPFYDNLKVWEYMDLYAGLYEIPENERKRKYIEEIDRVGLIDKKNSFIGELSRGMRQRLALAKTLLHDPQIIFMDEPASGLDPLARIKVKNIINELAGRGKTMIVSSHILSEMSGFCSTMAILEKGKLISYGPISDVGQDPGKIELRIRITKEADNINLILKGFDCVLECARLREGEYKVVLNAQKKILPNYLKYLFNSGVEISEFYRFGTDMEDAYLKAGARDVS